ncbi:MAG: hypothetical protein BroJett003_17770 [Planctomycetota bacterium]|nr:MAG: hypothetical protein BroJett003_17770 [Planctomycetota bacterium]
MKEPRLSAQQTAPGIVSGPSWFRDLAVLTAFACLVYLPGIGWGLPAFNSWSQDTIAGPNRTFVVDGWPQDWRGRYPPLHYLLNAGLYRTIEAVWTWRGLMTIDPATGAKVLAPPQADRIGLLILASRVLTFLMAVGTGWALRCAALRTTGDRFTALVAALTFCAGVDFAYFARLGNVDVPSMFWFAWSVVAYLRAIERLSAGRCAALGLLTAAAVGTKDGVAGAYPGMALMLLIETARTARSTSPLSRSGWGTVIASVLMRPVWLAGLASFVLPWLFINGAFHNWERFVARLEYWFDASADTLHAQQTRYDNPLTLALVSLRYAGGAVGWPLLATMLATVVAALCRGPRRAAILLVPACSYYLLTIQGALGFSYSRFLFPMLALAAVAGAGEIVAALRHPRRDRALTAVAALLVVIPTAVLLTALNLEMRGDSRYAAETWLAQHVPASARVGVFGKPQYLPRAVELGYRVDEIEMTPKSIAASDCDVLILSSFETQGYDGPQRDVLASLSEGMLGYREVARFEGRGYLAPRSWWRVAAWGTEPTGKISPTIRFLIRNRNP